MRPVPVPQPAKSIMASRRITVRSIATAIGKSDHYVSRTLNGWQAPSAEFKAQVAAILQLPQDVLFRRDWFEVQAS